MIEHIINWLAAIGFILIIKEIYLFIKNQRLKYNCKKIDLIVTDKDNPTDIKALIILTNKNIDHKITNKINKFLIDEFGYRIYYNTHK